MDSKIARSSSKSEQSELSPWAAGKEGSKPRLCLTLPGPRMSLGLHALAFILILLSRHLIPLTIRHCMLY